MIHTQHKSFILATAASLYVAIVAASAVNEATDSLDYAHGNRYFVEPDPIRYAKETKQQREAWSRALHFCTPISTDSTLSTECISALGEYFADEPIWEYTVPMHFYAAWGRRSADDSINPRYGSISSVPFGYDDYKMEEIPRWRDVFDGRLEQRSALFQKTVDDPACVELTPFRHSGIQPDKLQQCAAREMFKFAAFLEACTTAIQRIHVLRSEPMDVLYSGQSNYKMSTQVIDEYINDNELQETAQRRLDKGYLHASWVVQQCKSNDFELIPADYSDLISKSTQSLPPMSFMGYQELVWYPQPTIDDPSGEAISKNYLSLITRIHDTAMDLSAKSGDEWAIRSSWFSANWDIEFMKDAFQRFPLLKHRNLGSKYFSGGGLTTPERERHLAKLYLMLEKLAGSEIARQDIARHEIDISEIEEAVDYVRSGGELSYPRSWTDTPDETSKQLIETIKRRQHKERAELLEEARSSGMLQ